MGRYLRITEVMTEVGLPRSTIYKRIADGSFSKQISLGANAVAWAENEIKVWKEKRIEERDAKLYA